MSDETKTQAERDEAAVIELKKAAESAASKNHGEGERVRYIEDYFPDIDVVILAALRHIDTLTAERDRLRAAVEGVPEILVQASNLYRRSDISPEAAEMLLDKADAMDKAAGGTAGIDFERARKYHARRAFGAGQ